MNRLNGKPQEPTMTEEHKALFLEMVSDDTIDKMIELALHMKKYDVLAQYSDEEIDKHFEYEHDAFQEKMTAFFIIIEGNDPDDETDTE